MYEKKYIKKLNKKCYIKESFVIFWLNIDSSFEFWENLKKNSEEKSFLEKFTKIEVFLFINGNYSFWTEKLLCR